MSSADRRSPPGLCGSRIHLGGRVAKQLQNALSIYFFFPMQPASGADRRTSEDTNFAASFEGLLGPNQGYFSSIFSMADVGSRFFFCSLGLRGSLSSVGRSQVFHVEWKLGRSASVTRSSLIACVWTLNGGLLHKFPDISMRAVVFFSCYFYFSVAHIKNQTQIAVRCQFIKSICGAFSTYNRFLSTLLLGDVLLELSCPFRGR